MHIGLAVSVHTIQNHWMDLDKTWYGWYAMGSTLKLYTAYYCSHRYACVF
jgi:hypothetical protein